MPVPRAKLHIAGKPVELMSQLMDVRPEWKIVLDPFMGSASTGLAALQKGRKFIGIEMEPTYFDIACRRIEQAHAQGQLFDPQPIKTEQLALGEL